MKLTTTSAVLSLLALSLPLHAQGYADSSTPVDRNAQQGAGQSFDAGMQQLMQGEFQKALPLLERAANAGNPMAQYAAAKLLRRGFGTTKNHRRAVELLERATSGAKRFPEALNELANCLQYGTGIAKDEKRALDLLQKSAETGNADAMLALGNAYLLGMGTPKNKTLAFAWFTRAADLKQTYAINNLAAAANQMTSEEIDAGKGLASMLRKSQAFQGDTMQFQFSLKSAMHAAFLKGKKAYEARQLEVARAYLEPLALDKHLGGLFYIARMHEMGRGYKQDYYEAACIYYVAVQKGEQTSTGNLARLYKKGLGVEKNLSIAAELERITAWCGDVDAQNDYALACIQGKAVKRDPIAAFVWWTLAAEGGKQQAKNNLEILLSQDLPQSQRPAAEKKLAQVRAQMKQNYRPKAPGLKIDAPKFFERRATQPEPVKRRSYIGADDDIAKKDEPKKRSYETDDNVDRREDRRGDRREERRDPRNDKNPSKLTRFTSRDGKLTLLKPQAWKAEVGAVFGPGTYGVSVENPAETAGIMFIVIPGAARAFRNSKAFSQNILQAMSQEFGDLRVTNSISSPDGSKTRVDANFLEDGKRTVGVFQFTIEDGDGRVMAMGSEQSIWKSMQPTLQEMALSVRYPAPPAGGKGRGKTRRFGDQGGYGNQGYGNQQQQRSAQHGGTRRF